MENASKALLMAAGVLVGVLILSLMVTLFTSASMLSKDYDETKSAEAVQRFNANFIKYVGKDLTIHDAVTISNFAKANGVSVLNAKYENMIRSDVNEYPTPIKTYTLNITGYSVNGYINSISIT